MQVGQTKVYVCIIRRRVWRWKLREAVALGYDYVPDFWGFILPLIEEEFSFSDEDLFAWFGPIPEV